MKKFRSLGIISILCALMLCIGLFAACNTNNGDNNEASPWTYLYNEQADCYSIKVRDRSISGEIAIPAEYKGKPITSIGDSAFKDCSKVTSITIPDSITSIGSSAFEACFSLTSITIPDSITSIGDSAFSRCSKITSITIPDGVTSIGNSTFDYCTKLISVDIPDSITSIGSSAFWNCTSLESVMLSVNVNHIGNKAFSMADGHSTHHIRVYYKGSKDDWLKISMDSSTVILSYFFSAEQPTETGYHWHYDNNGNVEVWATT